MVRISQRSVPQRVDELLGLLPPESGGQADLLDRLHGPVLPQQQPDPRLETLPSISFMTSSMLFRQRENWQACDLTFDHHLQRGTNR
jgi:hypothetical protein